MYYYGIFKYSPKNKAPKQYKEGDEMYRIIMQNEYKSTAEYMDELIANASTPEGKAKWQRRKESRLFCLLVKPNQRVFYVCDENFKIVFETRKVFSKQGEFTPEVNDALIKYAFKAVIHGALRTDPTMEDLKENVGIENRIKSIPKETFLELEEIIKNHVKEESK